MKRTSRSNGTRKPCYPWIDAHIHFDQYSEQARERILQQANERGMEALISVSMHLDSCLDNLELAKRYPGRVIPAFGYHPEQSLPSEQELETLVSWMKEHASAMSAVGEIGLPYYTRTDSEQHGEVFDLAPYIRLLDRFLELAGQLGKPVVLHAVYEDAARVCDMLDRRGIARAHFHWFKGPAETVRRMADRGYYISFTPDLLYESEIIELAKYYPPDLCMAETDGPWPFEGPFEGRATEPDMVRDVAAAWAEIKGMSYDKACDILASNTRRFYGL